jgi:hypothetical protein
VLYTSAPEERTVYPDLPYPPLKGSRSGATIFVDDAVDALDLVDDAAPDAVHPD